MLIGHPRQKVFLAVGATDMRKAINGLAAIVQLDFGLNPFDPYLFAFCNRQRNKVKILEWSERGFWLHYFRLEKGSLPWPQEGDELSPLDLTWHDLRLILEGAALRPIEQRRITPPRYILYVQIFFCI